MPMERFEGLLEEDLDWELISQLAIWHRLIPLLYWRLSRGDSTSVPEGVMESLRVQFTRSVERSLRFTAELLGLIGTLRNEGIEAVPYKGPVLASRLYGNIALRMCSDLDIVVCRSDVDRTRGILIERGYHPWKELKGANHKFQLESRYSERFDRSDSTVELHWAFTNKDVAFPLVLEDFKPRLESYTLGGTNLSVFSQEDLLLILTVHGAKHLWNRLEWTCGIAELLRAAESIKWEELLARAAASRSERKLLLGLALAHDLYDAPLPDEIISRAQADRRVIELALQVTTLLFDGVRNKQGVDTFGRLEHDLFHFMLGDSLRDRVRYLGYRFTTPSRPERWATVSVGRHSINMHSFTRPFSVMAKLVPEIWRRL